MAIIDYLIESTSHYPLQDPPMYGDSDYKARGGILTHTTPQIFLSKVNPLEIDDEVEDNVSDLASMMKSGRKIDPAIVYIDNGKIVNHDGRHRALAAIALGISNFPVIVIDKSGRKITHVDFEDLGRQTNLNNKG